jgi:hypothetical protein
VRVLETQARPDVVAALQQMPVAQTTRQQRGGYPAEAVTVTVGYSQTMAQINNEQYLNLTSQERYVNPHTGQEELGSNEWQYRWENSSAEIISTDNGEWDPNVDPDLHVSGDKRSPVKPR